MHRPTENEKQTEPQFPDAGLPQPRGKVSPVLRSMYRRPLLALRNLIAWSPAPLPEPVVDADLAELPVVERVAETLRYSALRLEYAISRDGFLREWTKLVLRIAVVVAVPCVLLVPALTYFLGGLAQWTAFLRAAAVDLVTTIAALIALVLLFGVFIGITRNAARCSQRDSNGYR